MVHFIRSIHFGFVFIYKFTFRYDSHREQILRGSHTDYEDDSLDVFPYFTAACYKGYGDDADGFYTIYREVFDKLATEDIEFLDSPDEFDEIPTFGKSSSDYVTVVGPFYAYWQSYCTKKSYSWLCPHNISEIRDRRILREVEKETKKIAQKARKERNEQIRALVAFVRKRDKRAQEYKKYLEEKAERNRIKQQQHRLQQLKRNQQEAEEMRKNHKNVFNTSDHEQQLRQLEQAYGSDSSDYVDDDENDDEYSDDANDNGDANETNSAAEEYYVDDLYCVACNKSFKNASSYENHESSKKHRENTERLRKRMQHEDEQFEVSPDNDSYENELLSDEIHSDADIVDIPTIQKSGKKSKKSKNKIQVHAQSDDEADIKDVEKPLADIEIGNSCDADKDNNWCDDASTKKGKKSKNKKSNHLKVSMKILPSPSEPDDTTVENSETSAITKSSKKAKKVAKDGKSIAADSNSSSVDVSHTCVTCHVVFDSKNKLFGHLKKTNHGVYIPKTNGTTSAPENKRGKKK